MAGPFFYSTTTSMAVQVDDATTVGREAFARIAPACPAVADVITVHNLFDSLTTSSDNRLHFLIYDKYLRSLDKIIRSAKNTPGPLISNHQLAEGEIILDVDGTVPIQPVLQHIGISAWPEQSLFILSFLNSKAILDGTIGWMCVLRSCMRTDSFKETTSMRLSGWRYLQGLSWASFDVAQLEKLSAAFHLITKPCLLLNWLKVFPGEI